MLETISKDNSGKMSLKCTLMTTITIQSKAIFLNEGGLN